MNKDNPEYMDTPTLASRWLGNVPAGWNVRRLKNLAEMLVSNVDKHTKEDEIPVRLCNYVDVYKNDKINLQIPFMAATASREELKKFRLKQYDVLITKDSETWDDIGVPALVTETASDLISGYHLATLRPKAGMNGKYLFWSLQSRQASYQFHVGAKGVTRFGLSHNGILSVVLPCPPLTEQTAIVRYLDAADQKIQAYISAKQKLIALLEEQRQAIIHQAVTQGLDPNVKLKPSGVESLGDVPEHWEVRDLKSISEIQRGKFTHRPRNDASLYDGPYPFIQTGDISTAGKLVEEYKQTLNQKGLAVSTIFQSGTLVMTIAANIGDVAILNFDSCFPDSIVGINPGRGAHRDYLYYSLWSMKNELLREAPVNTQGNLNVSRIGSMRIPFPALEDQMTIAEYLDENTGAIDDTINCALRQIELIEEYRTRLIADVVTGKLDVRMVT